MHRIPFASLNLPPHRPDMHITRMTPGQKTAAHNHDFYEIFLVLSGTGTHILNGQSAGLEPGDLITLGPDDWHIYATTADESLAFVNVAVSAAAYASTQMLLNCPLDSWQRSTRLNRADTQRLASRLRRTMQTDAAGLLQLWKDIDTLLNTPATTTAPSPPPWLTKLRQDLADLPDSLGEPLSFWQSRAPCSAEHLSRSCRKHYGVTLRELISRARVERAKYLLRTTDHKIIAVAVDSGFENMANFHRTFARLVGTTPNAWRQTGAAVVPLLTPLPMGEAG